MRNPRFAPFGDDQSVTGPDGQEYVVRVSGAGVQRQNIFDYLRGVASALWWKLRRRKRWQVEVYRLDRRGVEYPSVLQVSMDTFEAADARAHRIKRDIAVGKLRWDRRHNPEQPPTDGPAS